MRMYVFRLRYDLSNILEKQNTNCVLTKSRFFHDTSLSNAAQFRWDYVSRKEKNTSICPKCSQNSSQFDQPDFFQKKENFDGLLETLFSENLK